MGGAACGKMRISRRNKRRKRNRKGKKTYLKKS